MARIDNSAFVLQRLDDLESVLSYSGLTVKELRPQLWQVLSQPFRGDNPSLAPKRHLVAGAVMAWGVRLKNEPAGLLLATVGLWSEADKGLPARAPQKFALEVMSLAVGRPFRRRGIATCLLDAASTWTERQGLAAILITMPLHRPSTAAMERLTASIGGWEDKPGIILATLTSPQKMEPLLRRFQRIAQRHQARMRYQISPYPSELSPALRRRVEDSSLPGWAQPVDPAADGFGDAPLDRSYSRLLWRADELIGWLVCHRPQQDLLRYTIGWVDEAWRERGGLFVLLADVIAEAHFQCRSRSDAHDHGAIQAQQGAPIARGCFGFQAANYRMLELSEKYFRPCCTHYIETRVRSKLL